MPNNKSMSELLCKVLFIDLDDTIWDFRANSVLSLRQVYDEFALKKRFPIMTGSSRCIWRRITNCGSCIITIG